MSEKQRRNSEILASHWNKKIATPSIRLFDRFNIGGVSEGIMINNIEMRITLTSPTIYVVNGIIVELTEDPFAQIKKFAESVGCVAESATIDNRSNSMPMWTTNGFPVMKSGLRETTFRAEFIETGILI